MPHAAGLARNADMAAYAIKVLSEVMHFSPDWVNELINAGPALKN